jgi:hypothetical protein
MTIFGSHAELNDLQLEKFVRETLGQVDPFCLSTMTFHSGKDPGQDHERLNFHDEGDSGVMCANNRILYKFDVFFPYNTMFRVKSHKGGLQVHVMLSDEQWCSQFDQYFLSYRVSVEDFTGDPTVDIIIALIRKYGRLV